MHLGGPPLPGQHELLLINQLIYKVQYEAANEKFKIFLKKSSKFYSYRNVFEELRMIIFQILCINAERYGDESVGLITNDLESAYYVDAMKLVNQAAFSIALGNYDNCKWTYSEQFKKMGINFDIERHSYFSMYTYLSRRGEPDILDQSFMKVKECVGYVAYLRSKLLREQPNPSLEIFENKFNTSKRNACKKALAELAKRFKKIIQMQPT